MSEHDQTESPATVGRAGLAQPVSAGILAALPGSPAPLPSCSPASPRSAPPDRGGVRPFRVTFGMGLLTLVFSTATERMPVTSPGRRRGRPFSLRRARRRRLSGAVGAFLAAAVLIVGRPWQALRPAGGVDTAGARQRHARRRPARLCFAPGKAVAAAASGASDLRRLGSACACPGY